ncbi:hypothetical protein MVEN_02609700 [Mycena venus]|uniref:Uncharacterized protein n=1 Tax=Mycena venus TaxID=2733690 RepID=A0A8H6TZF0_9AGAR|nr:hypothetical protein MVEN_02609700 [Mycena venus]
MHFAHSLWAVALLCVGVHGGATNYTLDDTSPAIVYTQAPLIRCSPGACDPDWTARLHNGTSSTTEAPIIIPFVGSAVYVYLGVLGFGTVNLDGKDVSVFFSATNASDANDIFLAFEDTTMPDAPHILTIYPQKADYIQFDYVIFTHNPRKSHRGAIIGGVIGGVAAAAILSVGAFFPAEA